MRPENLFEKNLQKPFFSTMVSDNISPASKVLSAFLIKEKWAIEIEKKKEYNKKETNRL